MSQQWTKAKKMKSSQFELQWRVFSIFLFSLYSPANGVYGGTISFSCFEKHLLLFPMGKA